MMLPNQPPMLPPQPMQPPQAPVQPQVAPQPQPPMPQGPVMLHDVTVVRKKKYAQARVMGVPPEEFGIERNARSLRDCNYCFHKVIRSEGELIAEGYDEQQVRALPSYRAWTNTEEINRDTVDENANAGQDELNKAARQVVIIEHYVRMDYDGRGKPGIYKVTTGDAQGQVLRLNGKLDIERFDAMPFAAMTPIIMTHRFFGRSIADIVMDIQRIKTALVRGLLDNTYLANNPRVEVCETMAGENTLDDLLVSRPGGIVRTKMPGGLNWQEVPTIGAHVYPLLEYQDSTREWRTGVTRQGQGIDANALQNQSATAVSQVFTMAQARIKLIARIFAETGIRDLFWLLHGTIKKHAQKQEVVRLRKNWVPVDPRNWKARDDLTIQVGLGTGSKAEQFARLMAIIQMQKDAVAFGLTNLVTTQNLYNSGKEAVKLLHGPDVDTFFTDLTTVPAPAPRPDPKLMEIQVKAQQEQAKTQADAAHQQMKTQADIALANRKFELDKQLAERKAQLEEHQMVLEFQMKEREHQRAEAEHGMKLQALAAQVQAKQQMAAADDGDSRS